MKSVPTEQEAVELVKGLTALCHKGEFHLTKWVSNSCKILSSIPKEERTQEVKELNLDKDELPIERTLGLLWCVMKMMNSSLTSLFSKNLTPEGTFYQQ